MIRPSENLDRTGYEVHVVADAVGGTSVTAHEMALRRIEQAGGKMISVTQLFCELQRDWRRKETVPGFRAAARASWPRTIDHPIAAEVQTGPLLPACEPPRCVS